MFGLVLDSLAGDVRLSAWTFGCLMLFISGKGMGMGGGYSWNEPLGYRIKSKDLIVRWGEGLLIPELKLHAELKL